MKSKFIMVAVAIAVAAPTAVTFEPAFAKSHRERVYKRDQNDYRYRCRRSSGTTGAVIGGVGGAVVGNQVGGGVLGTVAGGVGGALLGRHVDKRRTAERQRRRGC